MSTQKEYKSPSPVFCGGVILSFIFFFLIFLKHGEWLVHPNHYFLGNGADGVKNYMTTAYQVKHGTDYLHYKGMNYPYGEHVVFTDNQPIFTNILQFWRRNISDISDYTVGIMNVFQVISLFLGVIFSYLLFVRLSVPIWVAGSLAILMVALSPQNFRFYGHYGLSHTFIVPALLLLLWYYERGIKSTRWSLGIAALVVVSAQLHFYYFGLAAIFLTFYMLITVIRDRSMRNASRRLMDWAYMVVLPFVLLQWWMKATPDVNDRPTHPYGFMEYIGHWEGVFLPYQGMPLWEWINKTIVPIRLVGIEAWAYIGVVATLFTLVAIFSGFRVVGRSWQTEVKDTINNSYIKQIWWAGFLVVIFACLFPYLLSGDYWFSGLFGPLKQFRSFGRFNWVFFYVANVVAFYAIYHLSSRFTRNWARTAMVLVPLCLFGYEAFLFQNGRKLELAPNFLCKDLPEYKDEWVDKIDFKKYQAILPLPYYHNGSENLWYEPEPHIFKMVQRTAYKTGCPDMGVNMSRTSYGQMCKSVSLVKDLGHPHKILEDMKDNRPILIMLPADNWEVRRRKHAALLDNATYVFDNPEVRIFEITPEAIRKGNENTYHYFAGLYDNTSNEFNTQGWKASNKPWFLFYQSFDSLTTTSKIFKGAGAYTGLLSDTLKLYNGPMIKGRYALSMWSYANKDMGMTVEAKLFERRSADGHIISFKHEGMRYYLKKVVDGWAFYEFEFDVQEDNSNLEIFLEKKDVNVTYFLDEVMLRSVDVNYFRKDGDWVSFNNNWFVK